MFCRKGHLSPVNNPANSALQQPQRLAILRLKTEITAFTVISREATANSTSLQALRLSFYQSTNALRAQHLAHLPATLQHANRLKIGAESPRCGFLRPRAIEAERRLLSAVSTLRHTTIPFQHTECLQLLCQPRPIIHLRLAHRDNSRAILPQTY